MRLPVDVLLLDSEYRALVELARDLGKPKEAMAFSFIFCAMHGAASAVGDYLNIYGEVLDDVLRGDFTRKEEFCERNPKGPAPELLMAAQEQKIEPIRSFTVEVPIQILEMIEEHSVHVQLPLFEYVRIAVNTGVQYMNANKPKLQKLHAYLIEQRTKRN